MDKTTKYLGHYEKITDINNKTILPTIASSESRIVSQKPSGTSCHLPYKGGSPSVSYAEPPLKRKRPKHTFTLAEILVALGIIGVVSAMTLPSVIKNYQKHVTVNQLKKVYSEFSQAINMSSVQNETVNTWDFTIDAQDFFEKYLQPYLKVTKLDNSAKKSENESYTNKYMFQNGTVFYGRIYNNPKVQPYFYIIVDINGNKSPNKYGKDKFNYFITYKTSRNVDYNTGMGNFAVKNALNETGGIYPDGIGYSRNTLKNDSYRGCNKTGYHCSGLIMLDGWKIEDDYKW